MKIQLRALGLMTLGLLIFVTGCFPAVEASEERYQSFAISGKPTLDISGSDVDVTVRSQPGIQEIQITAVLRAWGASSRDAENNLSKIDLSMRQFGNEIRIRHQTSPSITFGIHFGDRIALEIVMPPEGDLRMHTDDGDVFVRNVTGSFNIGTDDGDIELVDVGGPFDLITDDGDISVRNGVGSFIAQSDDGDISFLGRLEGPRHSVASDDGDVTITIPADLALKIDVSTDDGSVRSSLPMTIEIEGDHHWSGTLNAPEMSLTISTDDGDISIRELVD